MSSKLDRAGFVLIVLVIAAIAVVLAARGIVFVLLLVAASALAAQLLARMVNVWASLVMLAFTPLLFLNIAYGDTTPLAVAALCVGAYGLHVRKYVAAGIAVALCLVQPNVALPAVAAVFVFATRARVAMVLTMLALAIVSVAAIGVAQNVEYFHTVLPLQRVSELTASDQYSLSRALFEAGLPPDACVALGRLFYIVVVIAGVLIAARASQRTSRDEFLAILPPAIALFGGIYVQDIQMMVALPAAIMLATLARTPFYQTLSAVALTLLVMVWTQHSGRASVGVDAVAVVSAMALVRWPSPAMRAAAALVASSLALLLLLSMESVEPAAAQPDRTLQQTEVARNVPTWGALLLIIACSMRLPLPSAQAPRSFDSAA